MNVTKLPFQNGIQLYVGVVDRDSQENDSDDLVDIITVQLRSDVLNSAGLTLTNVSGVHNYGKMSLTVRVHCAQFYHGEQYQFVDVCERDSIMCSGSGMCVKMMNSYTCVCDGGFIGEDCELIDYCFEQSCNGNGICTNEESSFVCNCNTGYTGIDCEINIDDCEDENCSDNGRCIDEVNSYHCEYAPGFSGTNCETNIDKCDGQNCSGEGLCMDGINSYACVCNAGYTGVSCSTNIDDCEFQNCTGNGECIWMESTRMLVYVLLGILVLIAAQTLTIVSFKIVLEMVNVWMESIRTLVYVLLGILVLIVAETSMIVSLRIAVEMVNVWMGSIHIPVSAIPDLQV